MAYFEHTEGFAQNRRTVLGVNLEQDLIEAVVARLTGLVLGQVGVNRAMSIVLASTSTSTA